MFINYFYTFLLKEYQMGRESSRGIFFNKYRFRNQLQYKHLFKNSGYLMEFTKGIKNFDWFKLI